MIDNFNLDHLCPADINKQHILFLVVHPVTLYVFRQLCKHINCRRLFNRAHKYRSLLILTKAYYILAFFAFEYRPLYNHIRNVCISGQDESVEISKSEIWGDLDLSSVRIDIVIEAFIVTLPQFNHFSPVFTRRSLDFQRTFPQ